MKYTNRSPTDSIESRLNWAFRQRSILQQQHRTHQPTHEAVVKFQRPVTISELKEFQKSMRNRLVYLSKTTGHELAVYYVIEGERNNCVHYHLLIRTTVADVEVKLGSLVEKASRGNATLRHCQDVQTVPAISRYVVKDLSSVRHGYKPILLFKAGLGLRQCGSWNHYFTQAKRKLWEDAKSERYGNPEPSVLRMTDRPQNSHSVKFAARLNFETVHRVSSRASTGVLSRRLGSVLTSDMNQIVWQSDVVWNGLRPCSTTATLFNTGRVSVPLFSKRRKARWSRDRSDSPLKSSASGVIVECTCHRRI